jgi:hypothetical protein
MMLLTVVRFVFKKLAKFTASRLYEARAEFGLGQSQIYRKLPEIHFLNFNLKTKHGSKSPREEVRNRVPTIFASKTTKTRGNLVTFLYKLLKN